MKKDYFVNIVLIGVYTILLVMAVLILFYDNTNPSAKEAPTPFVITVQSTPKITVVTATPSAVTPEPTVTPSFETVKPTLWEIVHLNNGVETSKHSVCEGTGVAAGVYIHCLDVVRGKVVNEYWVVAISLRELGDE